jgi:hypothetical protein
MVSRRGLKGERHKRFELFEGYEEYLTSTIYEITNPPLQSIIHSEVNPCALLPKLAMAISS